PLLAAPVFADGPWFARTARRHQAAKRAASAICWTLQSKAALRLRSRRTHQRFLWAGTREDPAVYGAMGFDTTRAAKLSWGQKVFANKRLRYWCATFQPQRSVLHFDRPAGL